MSGNKQAFLFTIAGGLVAQSVPVAAQTSGEGARPYVEEVIVMARKRQESIQDVPVVASVLTQAALESAKIDDLFTVATRTPGLLLGTAPASPGTQVSLRGIGTTALNATMDQSVSLNIDGLPLNQGNAYNVGMFDVGQVEVLKGPQSLFFGKNNTAGVIALRSADPTDEFEVITRVGYEDEAEEKEADLILSGPVSDSLKLRLATRYSEQDGYFINRAQGVPAVGGLTPTFDNYAPVEETTVRGTALWEPSSAFTARLKLNYNDYRMDGGATPQQITYCPEGIAPAAPNAVPFLTGEDCRLDRVLRLTWFNPAAFDGILNNGKPFHEMTQTFGSLELTFDLNDDLSLTSVTGYYDLDLFVQSLGAAAGTTTTSAAQVAFDEQQVTQEVRLTSDYSSPLNFMVGAFYQDAEQSNALRLPGNTALRLPAILQRVTGAVDIRSVSLFAQAMWDITQQLELSVGARWTDEKREHTMINYNPAQGSLGRVTRPDPQISSSNTSPEVTLTYKPTDTFTAFASYKTGFKSGSYTTANFQPPDRLASFGDEEVRGGEVGIKTTAMDRRLMASAAVYYYKYDDLQVGANDLSAIGGGNFVSIQRTLNAASATVKGVEFDVNFSPAAIDGLTLSSALNYNRAEYDSFPNAPCGNGQTIAQGCDQLFNPTTGRFTSQDLSGRRLVRAPEWSGFVGFDQQMPMGESLTLSFGAGANYTSEYSTALVDLPGFEQDDFIKYDANVALRGKEDRWEVALIGRNLGDELTKSMCTNSNNQNGAVFGGQLNGAVNGGAAGGDEAACFVERGRQVWGRFSLKF
jgi:outer membrane receptor protein involved in Fe transport